MVPRGRFRSRPKAGESRKISRRQPLRCKLDDRIDAQRSELNIAARMVLRFGGQPAHLDNLPRVPIGALQHFFTELIQVQVAQFEMVGGGFEQSFGVPLGKRWDIQCLRRISEEPGQCSQTESIPRGGEKSHTGRVMDSLQETVGSEAAACNAIQHHRHG